jgi:Fe2+ transport system protein FeoA
LRRAVHETTNSQRKSFGRSGATIAVVTVRELDHGTRFRAAQCPMPQENFCSGAVKLNQTGEREIPITRNPTTKSGVPLSSVTKGSKLVVTEIPPGQDRMRLIRLGLLTGQVIKCVERLPGGTVVIEKSLQEIAIGATLAESILVTYARTD